MACEPERLTLEEQAAVRRLAEDIPALWGAACTTARDRQTLARTMLDWRMIHLHDTAERVEIECPWAGGVVIRHVVIRSVRRFEQLANFDQLLARAEALRTAGPRSSRLPPA